MKKLLLATLASAALFAGTASAETVRIPHEVGFGGSESLDPISPSRFYETNQSLYSRLVRQDYEGNLDADLAEEWSSSPDATVWTFKLRSGVTFHNGNTFDAKDVVFSLMRTQSETIDSPVKAGLSIIENAKALDDQTVEVTLKSAHADFPILLIDYRVRMLDAETCGNDLNVVCETGIGTGPFKLVSLDALGTTKLTRFDDYWEGPAKVENIEVIAIADQDARIAALQAGQIDFIYSVTGQQKALFANNDNFTIQSIPTGRWVGFAMRTDTAPFDNAKVRKALRVLADRDAMGKLVFGQGGYTVTCDHPVWKGDQYRANISCDRNVEKARKLLAEAAAEKLNVELFVSDISEGAMRMAEVYQAQAKEAGVNVELVVAPSDGYWSDTWMKESFVATSWSERPADQILNEAYRSSASWNETFWKNEAFDQKLDNARQELSFDARKALYGSIQEQLWEEGGSFIPFHQNTTRVLSSKLSGLEPVADFAIRYHSIAKSK